jgi:hypothetical protein
MMESIIRMSLGAACVVCLIRVRLNGAGRWRTYLTGGDRRFPRG